MKLDMYILWDVGQNFYEAKFEFRPMRRAGEMTLPELVAYKWVSIWFLSRVSTLTRDIDIAILSVRLSVCPSVRDIPVLDENGLIYCHSFSHHTVAQSF